MKKLFALVLAVAMVLSMSLAASAAAKTQVGPLDSVSGLVVGKHIYQNGGKHEYVDAGHAAGDTTCQNADCFKTVAYGKTLYIPLYGDDTNHTQLSREDEVKNLKVSAKWDTNGEYIKSVDIAKKSERYFIAIKTHGTSMEENDVEGTVTISGKTYNAATDKYEKLPSKLDIDVVITLKFDEHNGYDSSYVLSNVIKKDPSIYIFDEKTKKSPTDEGDYYMQDEEFEFTCKENPDVTFTVDTTHQSKLILSMNTSSVKAVKDAYPEANLDYFVFNNPTFRKTGELFIPADDGSYIYEIVDGAVKDIDAEYDEYDEGFFIKTKTLGSYVVSDMELAAVAAVETDTAAAAAANPTTGAAI